MSLGNPAPTASLWHSPIPYLFGGLGAMLTLISLALIVLACSYKKSSSNSNSSSTHGQDGDDDDPEKPVGPPVLQALDPESRIVVIMAGNDKPTYLATPMVVATTPHLSLVNVPPCTCDQV